MATKFAIWGELRPLTGAFESRVRSMFDRVEQRGRKAADSFSKRMARGAAKLGRQAATGAGAGATAAVVAGAKEALDFFQVLEDIEVQAGATGAQMSAMQAAITATSRKTGVARTELAATGKTLVDLLGPSVAENTHLIDLLGRASVASGAEARDLAGLISAVSDSMGIAINDAEGMESALSAFLAAGKLGKVPLEEMSVVLQEVSADFKNVSFGGVKAAADMAAALQVARKSFGSASQAGTGMKAAINGLIKSSDRLRKKGIKVFTGKGENKRLRDFSEILTDLEKLDIKELTDALGSAEAAKFFLAFRGEGRKTFDDIAAAAENARDVSEDFGKRTGGQGFRIRKAFNDAKLAIAEAMTPERIETMVTALAKLLGAVGAVTDKFIDLGEGIGETAAKAVEGFEVLTGTDPKSVDERKRKRQLEFEEMENELLQQLGARGRIGRQVAPEIEASLARKAATGGALTEQEAAAQQLLEMGTLRTGEQQRRAEAGLKGLDELVAPMQLLVQEMRAQRGALVDNTRAQRGTPGSSVGRPSAPSLDTGRRP